VSTFFLNSEAYMYTFRPYAVSPGCVCCQCNQLLLSVASL